MFEITDAEIQGLVAKIVDRFHPERVILFGSRAHGTARTDSDVDLLVVMHYEGRAFRKALDILSALDFRKPLDLILRTPEELTQRYEAGDPLIRDALNSGQTLYAKPTH